MLPLWLDFPLVYTNAKMHVGIFDQDMGSVQQRNCNVSVLKNHIGNECHDIKSHFKYEVIN